MFGKVTLSAEPAEYKEQRAILQPTFGSHRMDAYLETMLEETENWLDRCGESGEFDLWKTFEQLSMYIAAGALMGREFRQRLGDEFWALYRDVAGGMEFVLPTNLPIPRFRRRDRAKEKLLKMLRPIIAERRRSPNSHQDFIQSLAEAKYSDGREVAEETIVGMILILVFAAYETTAAQISWALVQLIHHPRYLSLVLEEQSDVLGNRMENLTAANLQKLSRLDWALKESERMRPITTMLWRYTAKAYDLGGYHVPQGWITMVCPSITHHMPEIFSNPHRYDPERFSPARAEGSATPFSMVNFGGGFHKCLGMHFAHYEMKVVLSLLLSRYTLEQPGQLPNPDYSTGIMRPQSPYLIKYRRRQTMSNLEEAIRLA
jgi:sterol 14-demethylase